jgi:quercetin dioxygenase-like cupin family protein
MTVAHPPCTPFEASYYRTLPHEGPQEPLHCHDVPTTIEVLQGIVYLISERDERAMTPGDRAMLQPGERHRLFNAGHFEAHVLEGRG